MPANLTPEYRKAEEAFRAAKTTDEKIERLEDMIAALPKHKGTEHLYADLKRRRATLQRQLETSGKKSRHDSSAEIPRVGAAQIILIGPPNSGKSTIMSLVTNAHPEIGDYPFTTQQIQPGMVHFEDIQIQLVDTPPVTADSMPRHLLSVVRKADGVLLIADMSVDSTLEDIDAVLGAFSERHVQFIRERGTDDRDRIACRVIANKMDKPDAEERLELLCQMIGDRYKIYPFSCTRKKTVTELPKMLFDWMKIVRVYTKAPGEKADDGYPYTVFEGQSVGDICTLIHKDFYEKLRFARLWRGSNTPITVSRNEPVKDGDIIELHI